MAQPADIPGSLCVPEVGLLAALKWSRNSKGQGQIKQKIKDLPALFKNGLNLKKKHADVMANLEKNADSLVSNSTRKIYSETICCAGRALRDCFVSQAHHLLKDHLTDTGKFKKSCVGFEMVEWLLDQCSFVDTRTKAQGIWQILFELGIVSSATTSQESFEDKDICYQFSNDECDVLGCPFGKDEEWKNGVRLLGHIVPYVQSRRNPQIISEQRLAEEKIVSAGEVLQIQALALLSVTVKKELVAAIASRTEDSCKEEIRNYTKQVDLNDSAVKVKNNKSNEVSTIRIKEQGHDVLILQKVSSSSPAPVAGSALIDMRYVVVAGTPEKILEHLLNDIHLEEGECKEAEDQRTQLHQVVLVQSDDNKLDNIPGFIILINSDILLDDFLLTYTVFMTTNDLCHALLRQYCSPTQTEKQGDLHNSLYRKRKVLRIVSQWVYLYRTLLREDESTKLVFKNLYRSVLDDLFEYPSLEKDLKELQSLFRTPRRHTIDDCSPHKKNPTIFHQFSCRERWLQPKPFETEEVFCRVHLADHSYISFRTKMTTSAQEVLHRVAEKLQQCEEDLILVAVTLSEERQTFQPDDVSIFKSLDPTTRVFVCRKDSNNFLSVTAENETSQRAIQVLGMNMWHLANKLTNFDWDLFNCICEQELIYYTFCRGNKPANLDFLLQRCNEVQLWVTTEVLLCNQLSKRVQLVKKFIKAAAQSFHNKLNSLTWNRTLTPSCRALRNFNSFFAIIMGLNSAAVCRLSQTWEKVPGKFKKLFSELEHLTDPSLNHKAYRDAFKKMKPPKIPFMPLLLKDVTFIHEGNKTFLDNLVNFEKLHMIADTVRLLRHCRSNQISADGIQKDHQDVKTYIHHLHVIDNQQTLFQLSHRLEPRT